MVEEKEEHRETINAGWATTSLSYINAEAFTRTVNLRASENLGFHKPCKQKFTSILLILVMPRAHKVCQEVYGFHLMISHLITSPSVHLSTFVEVYIMKSLEGFSLNLTC